MLQRMLNTMIETKHIIAELSIQEKIFLYNALYEDLAGKGIDGDTELAHVNKAEMEALRAMGGSGTVNPNTNLIQFGGGSPPPPPPTSQTLSQTSEFPEELKPYITDVLGKAQAIQEKREQEGYRPYEGPQIAEFTPEQQEAFTGISGLVGEGGKYFDPATRLAASSAIAPRAGEVQQYMSPYMQNVVDIQQREAQRQADVAAQQLGAQAVSAGGFGGSRQAILEAEQQRNLQTQLGDIQARGLTAAYEDAQARMAAQRGRELAASGQFAQLGQIAPQQALKELTALEAVGAQQQALSQRGLDIAKSQFQQEQLFPEQTLQQYQSVIRGFPLAPSTYQTSQKTTPAPSYLQQAAGLGATAVGLTGAFGGFGKAKGGLVSRMQGGPVDQTNGLGSIVVKRQAGRRVGSNVVPPPEDILKETNKQRLERVFPGFKPKTLEEEYPEFVDRFRRVGIQLPGGKGSRFTRTLASGLSGIRDFVRETGSQMGRDVTSLGEYLFEEKGQTPLSLGQIRAVQELEARRPDLAKTGAIRASAKKILKNALADKTEVSPDLLAKSIALDLRPEEEVGRELAAEYVEVDIEAGRQQEDKLAELRKQQAGMSMAAASTAAPTAAPPQGGSEPFVPFSRSADPLSGMIVEPEGGDTSGFASFSLSADPLSGMIVEPEGGDTSGSDPSIPRASIKQQAVNIVKNKPSAEKTLTSFGKEISDFRKTLDERVEKKKTTAQRRKDSIERDKFLAVSQMGLDILAQPGGQTFLQAVGKGSKNLIPTLMKLNREELKVAENLDDLDFETAKAKFGLSEAEFNRYVKQRTLDIKQLKETGGITLGKGMPFDELKGMLASLTGKPKQTLGREGASLYVYRRINEDALSLLNPRQREDDSTIAAMERRIASDPKQIAKYTSEFEQKFPNARTSSLMGNNGSGAPAGRPSAINTLTNAQKALRDRRSGTPVTR